MPSLVTKSQEFFVKANETLFLPCEVLNGENHVILWIMNKTVLFQDIIFFGKEKNKFERLKNGTLVIKNVNFADTGEYICRVIDTFRSKNIDEIKVIHHVLVGTTPKIISLSTPNNLKEIKVGDNLILICKTTAVPKPKINWYFKRELLLRDSNETLEIDNVDYKNVGEYRCVTDNKLGAAHSSIYISFKHKPIVTIKEFRANETVQELKCEVEANPTASHIEWKFNGSVIEGDQNVAIRPENNVVKLVFKNFDVSNFGLYTCLAKNSLGWSERTVQVDLFPKKPNFHSITQSPKNIEITWTVLSTPPLTDNVVEYKREKNDVWKTEKAEIISIDHDVYIVGHNFTDLHHDKHFVRLISFNAYGASEPSIEHKFVVGDSKRHNGRIRTTFDEGAAITQPGSSQPDCSYPGKFGNQPDYYWRGYFGTVPKDAVPGGYSKDGNFTYIAQLASTKHNGIFPGNIYPGQKEAMICPGERALDDTYVKILCSNPQNKFEWISTTAVDSHLLTDYHWVVGGSEGTTETYIGRISFEGEVQVGRVFNSKSPHKGLWICNKDGTQQNFQSFELLVLAR